MISTDPAPESSPHSDDNCFEAQWSDLHYSCIMCEQLSRALAFVWHAVEHTEEGVQRRRGIRAAHFLAYELDVAAGSLEFDLRTLKRRERVDD